MEEIKVSVRPLVEYVYRAGSIEKGFGSQASMTEGTLAHQKVQKGYKDGDQKELPLMAVLEAEGIRFRIEGRCDGILAAEEGVVIDEIKSTKKDLNEIDEGGYPVHWAQAKCYAYMYALANELSGLTVQLTYVHLQTQEIIRYRRKYTALELERWMQGLLADYVPYARLRLKLLKEREISIAALPFPYESYRRGQRHFAGAVYKTITDQASLFASAPTGIGKTISALFPSLKAMGEGRIKKIFYLTAKTITRQVAEDALLVMEQKGLKVNSVTITAKDKICFQDNLSCSRESCVYCEGYYDRINGAVMDILSIETIMTREIIEKYAKKHRVCPFEFSLDLAYTADIVICDYNYIFDPKVSLKRLWDDAKKESVLLIDEAHNLVDRSRSMFSAEIVKSLYLALKREYKGASPGVFKASKKVNDFFIGERKKIPDSNYLVQDELPREIVEVLEEFCDAAEEELLAAGPSSQPELLLEAYFSANDFIKISKLFNDDYACMYIKENQDFSIKLLCLDASGLLGKAGNSYGSKIFFSATLQPVQFYKDMLGAKPEDYTLILPSPFEAHQTQVFIYPVSTRYHDRQKSHHPIAGMIKKALLAKQGNYLVFFPSYRYMQDVFLALEEIGHDANLIIQKTQMTEREREEFLASFKAGTAGVHAGFAVLGGIFSEGVDLIGDRLNGVMVVGVGLPQIGFERNVIKEHFTESGRNGYDYAYVFPGMNKILQAAGRLIRSESDSGTIILADDRYLTQKYQAMLPPEWRDYTILKAKFED
ncbi:ATP-dependent DNA helicase [Peribacillus sp. SCS-26]|uniref:ATP-dependent DNA helicase n=1 Tax=Paraperibacillus marinus TaxID=3115295 RepID=UPI0039067C8C